MKQGVKAMLSLMLFLEGKTANKTFIREDSYVYY